MYAIRSYYEQRSGELTVRVRDAPHDVAVPILDRSSRENRFIERQVSERSRITSYNVCYTKLLRAYAAAHAVRIVEGAELSALLARAARS